MSGSHLSEGETEIRAKAWEKKGGFHSEERHVPKRRAKRTFLGKVEGRMSG